MTDIRETVHCVEEAVALLASAAQIANRGGKDTNWPAFQKGVLECLARFNHNGNTARTYRLPGADSVGPSAN